MFIFEREQPDHHALRNRIIWLAKDYHMAQSLACLVKDKVADFQVRQVGWQPSPESWIKINLDGSVWNNHSAAMEGLLRIIIVVLLWALVHSWKFARLRWLSYGARSSV